jgi:hypothetical protein
MCDISSEGIRYRLNLGSAYCHSLQNVLFVFLHGCETWCLMSRREHRPVVSEIRVPSTVLMPKREKVTGVWRKLHNLYSMPNAYITRVISWRMRCAGHVASMREKCMQNFGTKT